MPQTSLLIKFLSLVISTLKLFIEAGIMMNYEQDGANVTQGFGTFLFAHVLFMAIYLPSFEIII